MADLTPPDFVGTTPDQILANLIADYEARAGKVLQPAQPEMLLIDAFSYQLSLNALRIQDAAEANLPQFATGAGLDYLVQGAGISRLPAVAAEVTLLLSLVPGHGNLVIPSGLRAQSVDGLATFVLTDDIVVTSLVNTYTAAFICDTPGTVGNGYVAGKISIILDPKPYLSTAANTIISAGGSDAETDEALRVRLYLAPSAFSSAGSIDAYKFFTFSASPLILDVAVDNGGGGVVNVYPLVAGGTTPTQVLNQVIAALSADRVRPLTDTVNVESPTVVNYTIEVEIVRYDSADASDLQTAIETALQVYVGAREIVLGRDIVKSQIEATASVPGVYDISVVEPASNTVITASQVAICTDITVTITGSQPG